MRALFRRTVIMLRKEMAEQTFDVRVEYSISQCSVLISFLFMVITAELGALNQPLVKLKTPFRILENYENHNQTDINTCSL